MLKRKSSPDKDDDYYFKKALKLGMDRGDLVVRRMLIQRVKSLLPFKILYRCLILKILKIIKRELCKIQFTFPHKIFSDFFQKSEKAKKISSIKDVRKWKSESDKFHMGSSLTLSKKEIKKSFGKKFYKELSSLKGKKWSNPIASTFGYHLVKIEKVIPRKTSSSFSDQK